MEISIKETKKVNAKILRINAKCADSCFASLEDDQGNELKDHDGYVPNFMPGQHYGDYIILDIDIDSGQIINWTPPTAAELESFIEGDQD